MAMRAIYGLTRCRQPQQEQRRCANDRAWRDATPLASEGQENAAARRFPASSRYIWADCVYRSPNRAGTPTRSCAIPSFHAGPMTTSPAGSAHPIVYLFLIAPFGAMGGYISVARGYQLRQAAVSVVEVAALVALSLVPQTWKFLWAPITDITWSRKRWYALAGVVTALGILAMGVVPSDPKSLPLLYIAVLVASVASTFLATASA